MIKHDNGELKPEDFDKTAIIIIKGIAYKVYHDGPKKLKKILYNPKVMGRPPGRKNNHKISDLLNEIEKLKDQKKIISHFTK